MEEDKEIKKFQSEIRSVPGRILEWIHEKISQVESFFGWPEKRRAKIEAEAEELFRSFTPGKIVETEVKVGK